MQPLAFISTLATTAAASATFTGYSVELAASANGLTKFVLYGTFDGATDTVFSTLNFEPRNGSTNNGFWHSDALTGSMASLTAGTWHPQFVINASAFDSFVCIGGATGFASGNTTSADAGWYDSDPLNLQGRVHDGRVLLAQFVIASGDLSPREYFLKLGYTNSNEGAPMQFGEGVFFLPTPSVIAMLGLAGLIARRRRA
ncbi:MAG: hypothetical protein EXS10_03920 [Phycisphaerales bacterium]|nr:hypothetical protein [Phycisphaerales bacterium]